MGTSRLDTTGSAAFLTRRPSVRLPLIAFTLCIFTSTSQAQIPSQWWLHQNFIEWHYNVIGGETFSSINVTDAKTRGVRALYFYVPYNGNINYFLGCDPIDWFNTYPSSGTNVDFQNLSTTAHNNGIAVGMFMVFEYEDFSNPIYVAGAANHSSFDGQIFDWVNGNPLLDWNFPATNFNSADAQTEIENIHNFWLTTMGVDGYMYDAVDSYEDITDAVKKQLLFTYPSSIKPVLTIDEGSDYQGGENAINYGFGAVDLPGSPVESVILGGSVTNLENSLSVRDYAVSKGGAIEQHVDLDEARQGFSDAKEALVFAAYAGTGNVVEFYHESYSGSWGGYGVDDPNDGWVNSSSTEQSALSAVMQAINSYAGEEPGGTRTHLSTGTSTTQYAVKMVSRNGANTALNIFNFGGSSASITVNLSGSGITVPQTPINLVTGGAGPAINSTSYTVTLPAYGYLLLEVRTGTGGSGGSLSGTVSSSSASVTLSSGTTSWAFFDGYDVNASGTASVSNVTAIGGSSTEYTNDPRAMSWTGGTPTASSTNNTSGVYISGTGNGFSFTVPASTASQTVHVYVGGWDSGGTLTATLSDSSAPTYTDTSLSNSSGQYDGVYTLTYKAASAGQTLTVTWKQASGSGNVTIQGATLP